MPLNRRNVFLKVWNDVIGARELEGKNWSFGMPHSLSSWDFRILTVNCIRGGCLVRRPWSIRFYRCIVIDSARARVWIISVPSGSMLTKSIIPPLLVVGNRPLGGVKAWRCSRPRIAFLKKISISAPCGKRRWCRNLPDAKSDGIFRGECRHLSFDRFLDAPHTPV